MKKQAALLFIPLFFAFGYLHQYRPGFSTPNTQVANADSSYEYDIYARHNPDAESDSGGSFFSWDSFRRNYNNARNNSSNDSGVTQQGSQSSAPSSVVSVQASTPTTASTPSSPGVPNTGVDSNTSSTTSSPAPVTPPSPPAVITPVTTFGGSPLTTFPQSSPPPPPQESQTNPLPAPPQPTPTPPPPPPPPAPLPLPPLPPLLPPTTIINLGGNLDSSSSPEQTPPPAPTTTPEASTPTTTTTTPPSTESSSEPAQQGTQSPPPVTSTTTSDNTPAQPPSGESVFTTGGVTFRFDDGWSSQFDSALPILDAAGIKGTFYIVTQQLQDDGFSGFMSKAQVLQLAGEGHEIAAHTQTHPHMPTLTSAQQKKEINGSLADLESWGLHPTSFSYPYGEYTQNTVKLVKAAGFASAVSTVETAVPPTADPLQLPGTSYQISDTPQKIEQDIQNAVDSHQWMILTFHRIDNSGDQYSVTPQTLQTVVDYVKAHNIRTVTVSQGASGL